MPRTFTLLKACALALVVLCLHSGYSAEASTVCWTNQQLYMRDQDIITYFPPNLACSTGGYSGNYSVQAFKGNFDVQYGDQLCNTDWKNDRYFESTDQHYDSGFPYQNQWTSTSNYASFFPKVNVWCRWIFGCEIQLTLCLTSNGLGSGSQEQEAKPVLAQGSVVRQED